MITKKIFGIDDNPVYRKVLEFIIEYKISHGGDSPTIRNLMQIAGNQSTSYTSWILRKLVETGELEAASFAPRVIIVKDMQILYPIKLSEKNPKENKMPTASPSFEVSNEDADLIHKIAMIAHNKFGMDLLTVEMDLTAVHANGNPLRLLDMLEMSDNLDFTHDIYGINEKLDRNTGKCKDFFEPRFTDYEELKRRNK